MIVPGHDFSRFQNPFSIVVMTTRVGKQIKTCAFCIFWSLEEAEQVGSFDTNCICSQLFGPFGVKKGNAGLI